MSYLDVLFTIYVGMSAIYLRFFLESRNEEKRFAAERKAFEEVEKNFAAELNAFQAERETFQRQRNMLLKNQEALLSEIIHLKAKANKVDECMNECKVKEEDKWT